MSLAVKLPLVMCVVLAVVLVTAVATTITTIRNAARQAATERVSRGVHEIVTVGIAGLAATTVRYRAIANDSAVQRALVHPAAASTRHRSATMSGGVGAVLSTLTAPTDSGMPVELWTADGARVTWVGDDVRPQLRMENGRDELPSEISSPPLPGDTTGDAIRFSALYGDGDRVFFWLIMPVKRAGKTIGYIAHQRRLAIGPQTQRTLRELSGDSVSLFYRNADGGFWTNGTRTAHTTLLQRIDSGNGTARLPSGEPVVFHEERFSTTPIVVGMYVPQRMLFSRSVRTVRTLELLSVVLLIAGTLVAWLIGRSVARPLGDLTHAAGALAAGDFSARAPDGGDLETMRLADSFNHMATELGTSRSALEKQKEEAQSANRAKSEFLTMMSHELRTPLNAIGGYVDLLQMGLRGPITEEQRRDLARIKTSQEHLLGLISAVLDLGRIEAGRVSYAMSVVHVDVMLRSMDALVAPQAAAKSVAIAHVPVGPAIGVRADREKLRQVVLNLLSNAIRHTPAGGTVTLSAQRAGPNIAIRVDDTGPGVPADRRELIFEPFVQLDRSLSKTREGMGLGLAISRDLARGMAGDLTAEDRPGGGARFVLVLPAAEVSADSREPNTGELPAART
jgi:signal transduction histidine kinase